mmetsp:Transcript_26220/g.48898  ORF Transcript_26220/g.48898 Transcript_26220/m.48898 type:complete len:355 (-) Transcript_26220:282-1346(-)
MLSSLRSRTLRGLSRAFRPSAFLRATTMRMSTIAPKPKADPEKCEVTGEIGNDGDFKQHFRMSKQEHPLKVKKAWQNPMQNHVWSKAEIEERMNDLPTHTPETLTDKAMHFLVKTVLYRTFNLITGFDRTNPTAKSCEWRLIILESVAGVPGMVAAGMRHFRSLRTLRRDYGWIHTLLEEAENERMHLLVCLKMFDAGPLTRLAVVASQYTMVGFLGLTYLLHPKALHRFVGYLEETASQTYFDLVTAVNTPGTNLNRDWAHLKAPQIAIDYWRMDKDSMWSDVLMNLFADETNHRDVNHTFATMKNDDPNPYVHKHLEDAAKAWQMTSKQQSTGPSTYTKVPSKAAAAKPSVS